MNKLAKLLKALSLIATRPWLLNNVLNDSGEWEKYVGKKYGMDKGFPEVDICDVLGGEMDDLISPYSFLDGGSLPTDLALLRGLAKGIANCRYFEIGTWRGESVANVAMIADECYTLNLSQLEIREAGYSEEYIRQYGVLSRQFDNIVHLRGNSVDYDYPGLNQKFDLIFIDGDHHYEMVKNDSIKVFTHLVHEDSIVVWHDYARNPETIRYEVMAGILDGTPRQYHNNLYFVSNTLCAVFTKKEWPSRSFSSPAYINKVFNVHLRSIPFEP